MGGVVVTCDSCHRSFTLAVDASPYLQLDLESRPCPFCEAYTLSTRAASDPDRAERPFRIRRDRRLLPGAGDTGP